VLFVVLVAISLWLSHESSTRPVTGSGATVESPLHHSLGPRDPRCDGLPADPNASDEYGCMDITKLGPGDTVIQTDEPSAPPG
jgi:hypothetical protein